MDLHFLFVVINFLIFLGLMCFLLRRPLKEFWGNRAESLRVEIAEAQGRCRKTEDLFASVNARVKEIEAEMAEMKLRMREDGELEKQRIVEDARIYAERLSEGTKRIAKQELGKARHRLRQKAATLTVQLAEKMIRQKMTAQDQVRLAQESLDDLAKQDILIAGRERA